MVLFLMSFVLFCFASVAYGSSIRFESKSHLPQNKAMYLEDVAVLSTDDSETLGALKTIKIADSAQEAERMTVQDILRKIRPQIKVIERHCECKLQIHIPKEMSQRSLNGDFLPEKLIARVQMAIKDECPSCDVEIKNTNRIRGDIPDKYTHWSSTMMAKELKGTTMVRVYFDDNALNPLVYQMYVGIKKPVLKLTQPVPAGTLLTATDIDTVVMDVTHEARDFATLEDLHNTELKRSLGAGELVSIGDLILKYKIKLGEQIKVIIKNQSLEMEMSGVAQKNGRVGDKIPVRLAATRKDVTGEILSDGRVAL